MKHLLAIIATALLLGCSDDNQCEVDADCRDYERSVCDEGRCVCEFDELDRCYCDDQSRCDEVYGAGERICSEGVCMECVEDADCGDLQSCGTNGVCYDIECRTDADCEVGFCREDRHDCVACRSGEDCPASFQCRDDGACVECVADDQCADDEVCDVDIRPAPEVEIVGTNQCGLDCSPTCRSECAEDPDCLDRPECVVTDPDCLDGTCPTWDECEELPEECELRLRDCPAGSCEALAASFLAPVHYACLPTPCLYDFECDDGEVCYEGQCLSSCDRPGDCEDGEVCLARAYFDRGACLEEQPE